MAYTPQQIRNGRGVLHRVAERAKTGDWTPRDARRVARICTMVIMTESNMHMDANPNVPGSMNLPHDGVGSDHASVGLFQQQVPMWGSAAECMDINHSTDKFVDTLLHTGLSRYGSAPTWVACQAVQRSAFRDGSNYKANRARAFAFVLRYWGRTVREVQAAK